MNDYNWYHGILWTGFFIDLSFLIVCLFLCTRNYQPKYIKAFIILGFSNLPFTIAIMLKFYGVDQKSEALNLITTLIRVCEPLFEFSFFSYLFFQFIPSLLFKKLMLMPISLFAIIYCIAIIIELYKKNSLLSTFKFASFLVLNLTIITMCFIYFKKLFELQAIQNLSKQPSFWIVTGVFFYFTTEIVTDIFTNYFIVKQMQEQALSIFSVNYFSELIEYTLFIKAFLCKTKPS